MARRSGMVYSTPRMPPAAQAANVGQNGTSFHQPIMIKPGNTKMTEESVPPAEATVCTMLFSRMSPCFNMRSTAIEMTAAGMEDANVIPTRNPRYTLAAVKTRVSTAQPRRRLRRVSSLGCGDAVVGVAGCRMAFELVFFQHVDIPHEKASGKIARFPMFHATIQRLDIFSLIRFSKDAANAKPRIEEKRIGRYPSSNAHFHQIKVMGCGYHFGVIPERGVRKHAEIRKYAFFQQGFPPETSFVRLRADIKHQIS